MRMSTLVKEKMPDLFLTKEGEFEDPYKGDVELGRVPKRPINADGSPFIGALFPAGMVRFKTANAAGDDGRFDLSQQDLSLILRGLADAPEGVVVRHVDESSRRRLVDGLCGNQLVEAWGPKFDFHTG